MKDAKTILNNMTIEEKASLLSGHNFMHTNEIPSVSLPAIECSDGPHGLRKQEAGGDNGVSQSLPSTAFPTAATTACSWNRKNLEKMGAAIAEECRYYGVDVILGPAINIKRNPLCGRNFEYFSEDPYLTAEMGSSLTSGIQNNGVGVSVKHFAANNSENYRFMGNSIVDERALREIYFKAFERIVKETKPASLMCAYNRINGVYCSENKWLLNDVLRKEWNYEGIVMTDWGAAHDRVAGVKAGLDLEMPGDTICRSWILEAIKDGTLTTNELDEATERMIDFVNKWSHSDKIDNCDFEAHNTLAAEIAKDSAVLLKNDGILPLSSTDEIFVAGDLFEKMRYQGSGSSMIHPTSIDSPKVAFEKRNIKYKYSKGYSESKEKPEENLIKEAVSESLGFDKVLVFAGLTDFVESEGGDRDNMRLPENQYALINALVEAGRKVVVVLYGGSPMELPFAESVSAILDMYLPGQNGGEATAAILFGDVNPSGKLAETWAKKYEDIPLSENFAKEVNEIYKESIYVGYRYYFTANKKPRYPFGFGLSYTKFEYSDIKVIDCNEKIKVSCKIKNIGSREGAEVVQLYVGNPNNKGVFFAERELRAFDKIYLNTGESKEVELAFDKNDLKYYDIQKKEWVLISGDYRILIGASSEDIRLESIISIDGEKEGNYSDRIVSAYKNADIENVSDEVFEDMLGSKLPPKEKSKPITLESRLDEYKKTFFGRILFNKMTGVAVKMKKQAQKLPDGPEKDNLLKGAHFLYRIMSTNSARTLVMSSSGAFTYDMALGFVELANGHPIKASKLMKSKKK